MSTPSIKILPNPPMDSDEALPDLFSVIPQDETSVIRKHSRSFSMAARWLPVDVRVDVEKLYAWCRWCDEAVDSAQDPHDATARLAILRDDVERVFDGQDVRHPASRWLAELVQSRGIRQSEALDLLAGMEIDLHLGQVEDEEALMRYCYCVAGVVGLMMCRVMGVHNRSAEKHAIDLGMAMQLTNIARDVADDWNRGRCYIPKTWVEVELPHTDLDPLDNLALGSRGKLMSVLYGGIGFQPVVLNSQAGSLGHLFPARCLAIEPPSNSAVRKSVERLLSMAEVRYSSGLTGIAYLPGGCHPAIVFAAKLYREIGREILRQEARVMDCRIAVPSLRLALIAFSTLITSLSDYVRSSGFGMSSFFTNFKEMPIMISKEQRMSDAKFLAYLGISLTSFMASALFVMVSLHPKDPSYAALPIIYAIVSVGIGITANILARKAAVQFQELKRQID